MDYINSKIVSFFESYKVGLDIILRIILKYIYRKPIYSIKKSVNLGDRTMYRILDKLISRMSTSNFNNNNKLGCPDINVQIDEAMLNDSIKTDREIAQSNRADVSCIIKYDGNRGRLFDTAIPYK